MKVNRKLMKTAREGRVRTREVINNCRETGVSRDMAVYYLDSSSMGILSSVVGGSVGMMASMGAGVYVLANIVSGINGHFGSEAGVVSFIGGSLAFAAVSTHLYGEVFIDNATPYREIANIAERNRLAVEDVAYPLQGELLLEGVL